MHHRDYAKHAQAAIAIALNALERRELGRAEAMLRQFTVEGLRDPAIDNALGRIAMLAQRPDLAREHFRRALDLNPSFKSAARNLRAAEDALTQPDGIDFRASRDGNLRASRFLLIKAWGCGFWSDVDMALGGLLLAEITGRTAIIDWTRGSRFCEDLSRSAWSDFFLPPSPSADLSTLPALASTLAPTDFFPPKWSRDTIAEPVLNRTEGEGSCLRAAHFINRAEPMAVYDFHTPLITVAQWLHATHPLHGMARPALFRALAHRYLTPTPDVLARVDALHHSLLNGQPFLAAHWRGTDKHTEYHTDWSRVEAQFIAALLDRLALHPSLKLLLITDDQRFLERAAARLGDRLVTTDAARGAGPVGVHFRFELGHRRLGMDVLTDTLLAARSESFVGVAFSNVSAFAASLMPEHKPNMLLGDHLHDRHAVGVE